MRRTIDVIVIDGQKDFCDPNGSLFVTGADEDVKRASRWIEANKRKISRLHMTGDSHHRNSIWHPNWWVDQRGNAPGPFTQIKHADVKNRLWLPRIAGTEGPTMEYLEQLEARGRKTHTIWPVHCLIFDEGATIMPSLQAAAHEWSEANGELVNYVAKGTNPFREQFSALEAEVPDPNDESTQLNMDLIQRQAQVDEMVWMGWALSHCLMESMMSSINNLPPEVVQKMVIFRDCTSNVPGFEKMGDDFLLFAQSRGVKVTNSTDYQL